MPTTVRVEIKGIDTIMRKFTIMQGRIIEIIVLNNKEYSQKIKLRAKELVPVDLGNLRRSIGSKSKDKGTTVIIGSRTEYSTELGTKPGTRVPPKQLIGWCVRHGMPGLQYLVSRKIEQVGSPKQPYMLPAFEEYSAEYRIDLAKKVKALVEKT